MLSFPRRAWLPRSLRTRTCITAALPLPPLLTCRALQVWDLIIVGAGVAGAAFAYQQGCSGRRVLLLERDLSQPDRIVGELLQVGWSGRGA